MGESVDQASMNEATFWEVVADTIGESPAIIQGERVVTWREFEERAARLAGALASFGVGPNGRVAIDLYNGIEYLETVFAAFKLRAVPINVNYRYRERELAYILEDSSSTVLVFHGSLAQRVLNVTSSLGRPLTLVEVPAGEPLAPGAFDYETLLARHDPCARIERDAEDEFILYTGGTTGMPRGVVWSHGGLYGMQRGQYLSRGMEPPESLPALAGAVRQVAADGRAPTNLIASPLMHGTALFTSMGTFTIGGRVVLCESRSLDAGEMCRLIERHRIRNLTIVGDVFAKPLLEALDRAEAEGRPYDLSSLEHVHSVGVTFSAPM